MTAPLAPIRVGIVGSGGMAEYHAKKFSSLPGVTVCACSDRLAEHASGFARRLGIPRWFASSAELAKSGLVDCIATAVVDAAHYAVAMDALEQRLPVFVEKPIARTVAEAAALLAAARAAGVPAHVNFSKRNAAALSQARRLVTEGLIGKISGASLSYLQSWLLHDAWGKWDETPRWRWRVSPALSTAGVIGDLESHIVDAVRFMLGEIDSVSCATTSLARDPDNPMLPGAPDTCAAIFTLSSGVIVSSRASWRAAGHLDTFAFQIEGDAGTITGNLADSRDSVRTSTQSQTAWTVVKADPVASTYEHFIAVVRGEPDQGSDFREGYAVQRVIEACAVSAREGRMIAPGAVG